MSKFNGFPAGKTHLTPLPAAFFSELLPEIDHLGELKVSLYAFWFLDRLEGEFRYLRLADFSGDRILMESLSRDPAQALNLLQDGLERAVQRGTLLRAGPAGSGPQDSLYFLNSPRGRAAVAALQDHQWSPDQIERAALTLDVERPNIYHLYEQNIGPLTPMIAEALREAELSYPMDWIEAAIRAAVESNVRRWRYVDAILKSRLEKEHDEANRGKSQKDRRRYVQGEYGEFIEH